MSGADKRREVGPVARGSTDVLVAQVIDVGMIEGRGHSGK